MAISWEFIGAALVLFLCLVGALLVGFLFGQKFTQMRLGAAKKEAEKILEGAKKESETKKYYESAISKWQSDINRKQSYIDKKRNETKDITNKLSKIDQKEILYEIDSRKDHIMTNLEVALNNADLFLKNNFFPPEYKNADFKAIRDILYKQDGFIKESKDEISVTLKHYRQELDHQMLAEYVVKKINAAEIITDEGKRLRMKVL